MSTNWLVWQGTEGASLDRRVRGLLQALLRCLRTSRKIINDAPLPSTATAHTCRVPCSKTHSKCWPRMTWSWDQRTMEATISYGQRLPILRFSHATEWAPAAHWKHFYRAHELLRFL